MEFPYNINLDLPTDVVVLSSSKRYLHLKRIDACVEESTNEPSYVCADIMRNTDREIQKSTQERLSLYINIMGQKSAQAQGLKEPITSADKLIRSNHRLYMMKDASANNGMGVLVGILKVGMKKLFLANGHDDQVEVNPVCLLDFFVIDSRQRQGYGLRLFKVMLELEGITPVQLAIDRPSKYLLCFLKKYYKMDQPQFHPNKYVVFPGFFRSVGGLCSGPQADKQVQNHNGDKSQQNDELKNKPPSSIVCHDTDVPLPSRAAFKSSQGIVTPTRFNSERKWQQMYDSWNVVGVPPRDYSYIKNAGNQPLGSEISNTIMQQPMKPNYTPL